MSVEILTILMFLTLMATIALGHPLAVTLAAVATVFGLIDNGFNVPGLLGLFANNAWGIFLKLYPGGDSAIYLHGADPGSIQGLRRVVRRALHCSGRPARRPGTGGYRGQHGVRRDHRYCRRFGRGYGPDGRDRHCCDEATTPPFPPELSVLLEPSASSSRHRSCWWFMAA